MTTRNVAEAEACTFQWRILNISHCFWIEKGKPIYSPTFFADALEGTKWSLWLYPMKDKYDDFGLYLQREDCSGPNDITVSYRFAFLDKHGSLCYEFEDTRFFHKDVQGSWNWDNSNSDIWEEIFVSKRTTFLPEDTLTIQCLIWKTELLPVRQIYLYGITVFEMKRRSLVWGDKFSSLQPGLIYKLKDNLVDIDLVLNKELGFEKQIIIKVNSFDENLNYLSLKYSFIDSNGKKENCKIKSYFASDLKKGELSSTLLYPKRLIKNRSQCLPNDVLSVNFEYVYVTEIKSNKSFDCGIISPRLENELVENKEKHVGKQKFENTAFLVEDLNSMYNYGICSDVELRTSTKTFPVHKGILSARSPVFRTMFNHDMKEKNCGHVDITDMDDDTVHRMLLYIYTSILEEDLQFESVSKLYTAADKYEILSLRNGCSLFLKDSLCPTKACDVFNLAYLHQDEDLKNVVEAYILDHDEVFSSLEWKHFMDSNLKLASDIMYKKVNHGKIYPSNV